MRRLAIGLALRPWARQSLIVPQENCLQTTFGAISGPARVSKSLFCRSSLVTPRRAFHCYDRKAGSMTRIGRCPDPALPLHCAPIAQTMNYPCIFNGIVALKTEWQRIGHINAESRAPFCHLGGQTVMVLSRMSARFDPALPVDTTGNTYLRRQPWRNM